MKKRMRIKIILAICGFNFFLLSVAQENYSGYTLIWSDEFNGGYSNPHAETGLDEDTWNFETGNGSGGWGTGQRDYSTTDRENVEVSDGTLKIRTQRNHPNQTYEYTSGRITSKGKKGFLYGKIEARIRTINMTEPGRGFAFWMMPNSLPAGSTSLMWPQGGEIDIFEYNGLYPQYNLGSAHFAWKWNNNNWGGDANHGHAGGIYNPLDRTIQYLAQGRGGCNGPAMSAGNSYLLGAEYHIYGINWFNDRIEFYVDQDIYHTFYFNNELSWCGISKVNTQGNHYIETGFDFGKTEGGEIFNEFFRTFENEFYLILSAGVGGNNTYGGNITDGNNPSTWTCTTEIDWVRAYKLNDVNPPQIEFDLALYNAFTGNITVQPTKVSGDNISKIEYYVNSWQSKAKVVNGSSFVWNQPNAGNYTLYVRACDANGYWGNWAKTIYSVKEQGSGSGDDDQNKDDYWVIYRDSFDGLNGEIKDCREEVDTWGSDVISSSNCSPIEGSNSICLETKSQNEAYWVGFALPTTNNKEYDLTELIGYSLHFKIKSNYPSPFKIVIKESDSNEAFYMLSSTSGNGYTNNNTWTDVTIPLSSFTNLDYTANKGSEFLFGLFAEQWQEPNTFSKHIELDDIYFYNPNASSVNDKEIGNKAIVYSNNGSAVIKNAALGTPVMIYSINGILQAVDVVTSDEYRVALPVGSYIVCCGNEVSKIFVH